MFLEDVQFWVSVTFMESVQSWSISLLFFLWKVSNPGHGTKIARDEIGTKISATILSSL